MATTDYTVQGASQSLPSLNPDNSGGVVAVSRRGEQLVVPANQEWVNKERSFMVSNAAIQTALAVGGTSYSATAPAFLLDVAAGITMKNLHVRLRQGGTVAGGVITVLLTVDQINRYSSGGTALAVRNMKIGGSTTLANRRQSSVAAYQGATGAAVNTNITLYSTILTPDVGAGTLVNSPNASIDYPVLGETVPDLVGPASVVIYTFAGSTQPSWFFHIDWVEVDS